MWEAGWARLTMWHDVDCFADEASEDWAARRHGLYFVAWKAVRSWCVFTWCWSLGTVGMVDTVK